jgi:hypothetical protein
MTDASETAGLLLGLTREALARPDLATGPRVTSNERRRGNVDALSKPAPATFRPPPERDADRAAILTAVAGAKS